MPLLEPLDEPVSSSPKQSDVWEKAKAISSIASAVVIPLVLLWVGNGFTSAIKERELQGKFVELAVQILREEPNEQQLGLRDWATQVLNEYSGVSFSNETKEALIERTPLPSGPERYEGRLGNTERGDGIRFRGRGYLMIVGRAYYSEYSQALGIDLVSNPDQAMEPKVAATILALWFKERQDELFAILSENHTVGARKMVVGGTDRLAAVVAERYAVYLSALEQSAPGTTALSVPGISNSAWLSEHLPILLVALREHKVDRKSVQAYALATAEVETSQGRRMKERVP